MPYEKILISHKFGIISQSHKKILQQRLLQRSFDLQKESAKKYKKNDELINLQITEDFVKDYNESSLERRLKLDHQCLQMFEKIKKKLSSPTLDDLGVQLAWAELSQLCQCSSPIRDECMDLFIHSLKNMRLSNTQLPTLFFLAETVIYWIRTDIINQPFLRSFELKLLKISYLIFHRIHFHYMEESLDHQDDLKEHLSIYLQGFDECLDAYTPYPDALFYMKFIITVGDVIKNSISQKNVNKKAVLDAILNRDVRQEDDVAALSDQPSDENEFKQEKSNSTTTSTVEKAKRPKPMSTFLKQCILIFNCACKSNFNEAELNDHLVFLIERSLDINRNNLIDGVNAFFILGECSKYNLSVLNAFLTLSKTEFIDLCENSETKTGKTPREESLIQSIELWGWELACLYVDILADIIITSENLTIKKKALFGFHNDVSDLMRQKSLGNNLFGLGLIDTARFQLLTPKDSNESEDWSWKVRYSAIKALVRISKVLKKDLEELRQVCWSILVVFEETEFNKNVLEAIRVGQVMDKKEEKPKSSRYKPNDKRQNGNNNNNIASDSISRTLSENKNFYCQMSNKFYNLIKDVSDSFKSIKQIEKPTKFNLNDDDNASSDIMRVNHFPDEDNNSSITQQNNSTINKKVSSSYHSSATNKSLNPLMNELNKKRTTLKEEIIIKNKFSNKIPDYFNRKNFDLMRIVEDQYRKEEIKNFEESQAQKEKSNT